MTKCDKVMMGKKDGRGAVGGQDPGPPGGGGALAGFSVQALDQPVTVEESKARQTKAEKGLA